MIKVSVIIPVYNVENYLDEAMESITRQTLDDIEIICINDGSTDTSLSILEKYARKDGRIIIIDKNNEGYGVGMNIGLETARGEYIGILEPDDYVPLNMYEDLYAAAKENSLDFVKADFYRFSTDANTGNRYLEYNHIDPSGENYNRVITPRDEPFVTRFIMNTWSGIYRRSFIEEHHIRHNTTPGASFQDNGFFWQTFMYAQRCMFINRPYYMNRRDNPDSSVNSREKVYCMNIEYDHIYDIFMRPENEELWECFKYYFTLKRFHNYMFTLTRIDDSFKPEFIRRFGKELKRAGDKDELDFSLFTSLECEKIDILINNPEKYLEKYQNKRPEASSLSGEEKLKTELARVKASHAYRLGRALTAPARAAVKAARRIKHRS